jgi:DNA-directed RNA polymerase beta subunit
MSDTPTKEILDHSFLAEELLIPNVNHCDGGRVNMFTSHQGQLLVYKGAEPPKVFTRFEKQIGKYSTGLKIAKKDLQIMEILEFNQNHKLIITFDGDEYNIINWTKAKNLTETYGFEQELNETEVVKGNTIAEGDWIYKNGMYDENLNLKFGNNLKSVFIPFHGLTYEDGIVIGQSASEKYGHQQVQIFDIVLNQNDILINLLGTKEVYKGIPRIGEKITGGILAARRRINYSTMLDEMRDTEFRKVNPNDTPFYASGTVTDIEVFCNLPEELDLAYNSYFKEITDTQDKIYTKLINLVEKYKKAGSKLSEDLSYWYQKAKDYKNPEIKFSFDKREFEGIVVRVTVIIDVPLAVGAKLTGRYGNKGVISKIVPDDEMPMSEDGLHRADIALNSLGVIGRMNLAQCFEQELNFIADYIIRENKDDDEKLLSEIMTFYEMVCPKYGQFIQENIIDTDDGENEVLALWLEEAKEHGILIHQPPFYENSTPQLMEDLYTRFPVEKIKFKGVEDKLVIGDMYFIMLKHVPAGKFSARAAEMTSLLDVPYKNNDKYKKGNALFNSNPIKFGEQEYFNFALLEQPETVDKFLKAYSSSRTNRQNMIRTLLQKDVKTLESIEVDQDIDASNAAQSVRAMFNGIGVKVVKTSESEVE